MRPSGTLLWHNSVFLLFLHSLFPVDDDERGEGQSEKMGPVRENTELPLGQQRSFEAPEDWHLST